MTIGSLREQIIYPDSVEDCNRKGITDKNLAEMLSQVQLSYIIDREGLSTLLLHPTLPFPVSTCPHFLLFL
jgi:ABC-type uncharacterized transport system fused permease/ATPase subunit